MEYHYTTEKNIQMLIELMKAHHVKKIIASPGSTNISFIASLKHDKYFEIYSAPDERSAAYMACGLAAESGDPVALSCTGATASRNYVPGLTEAFYRKLPILAITSTQHMGQIDQYVPQVIDRTQMLNDIVNLSVQIPTIYDEMDAWSINTKINKALLELRHKGGGPVHINITTSYPFHPIDFSTKKLPLTRAIYRFEYGEKFPQIEGKKNAIFVGNHSIMNEALIKEIELFCENYNGVVLCDHTSNYSGKYGISASLVTSQDSYTPACINIDVLIHIGQVSGAYLKLNPNQVWRVNPDGVIRDTFRKLKYVFEVREVDFFKYYNEGSQNKTQNTFFDEWNKAYIHLNEKVKEEELPFSNIWIAQKTLDCIPQGSFLHLGILNSLRAWNFCHIRKDINGFSNTGGFGIDGLMSSMLGSSLANKKKIHYQIIGDLAFFYDMNVLGNMRILLINNGKGTEFRNYTNFASKFGDEADEYLAAGGHYGNKSYELVKHYAEDLGFIYLFARTKEEYLNNLNYFCDSEIGDKPILFEVFTNNEDENKALYIMRNLTTTKSDLIKRFAKETVKEVVGPSGFNMLKKAIRR